MEAHTSYNFSPRIIFLFEHQVTSLHLVGHSEVDWKITGTGSIQQFFLEPDSSIMLHASCAYGHSFHEVRGGRLLFDEDGVDAAVGELGCHC